LDLEDVEVVVLYLFLQLVGQSQLVVVRKFTPLQVLVLLRFLVVLVMLILLQSVLVEVAVDPMAQQDPEALVVEHQ
jgi:hypothetical protein